MTTMRTATSASDGKKYPRFICKWEIEQDRYVVRLHHGPTAKEANMYPAPVFMARNLQAVNNWIDGEVTARVERQRQNKL